MPNKTLILVDGSSYLFRAYHALPPLTNSKNQPTGAIYGVINMLRRLMNDYKPEHIAVVFDPKGKTFRNELYADYKANRLAMPDELSVQIPPLFSIIKALGLPLIIVDGVEADDVIGTLARQATKLHMPTLISTSDKDMAQLVDSHITCINTMSDSIMDITGVVQKFGVQPTQIIDYLTLVGDTSDNIPGVPKVGPKTAAKWLAEYNTLDNLIKHKDAIKGKVGDYFRATIEQLPLTKQLVTIKTDVMLPITIEQLIPGVVDQKKLIELFTELEFKSWLKDVLVEQESPKNRDYVTILDNDAWQKWLLQLTAAEQFAFDTETTSLDAITAELVGISMAITPNNAAYVPLAHDYTGAPPQLARAEILADIKNLFNNSKKTLIGQNIKFDMNVLAKYSIEFNLNLVDTMLESYILDSTASRHDMDSLALKYLGKNTIHFADIAGKGAKQKTFNQIDIATATEYAAEDADITLQLHHKLWHKLKDDKDLRDVLLTIEMPLLPVLARMERHGVLIDEAQLRDLSNKFAKRIQELEQQAYKIAGRVFNLASPKQLQEIFYQQLGLPIIRKTPTGAPSTAEDVLQELALDYPLPQVILEHRSLSKLKSTYTDKLPEQINPNTGRVHTSYNQAVTTTGRLSSTEPNLQNIPIRTEEGQKIRQAFIASKGHKIISADYSQIELRIMAHLANDTGLKKAFDQGLDIHRATAAEVFNVPLAEVTTNQRRNAKAINFGLIYGMSAFGLAKQLKIERQLAEEYIALYFHRYPGVKIYMESIKELAREQGYVETLFGRRLYVPEIRASNFQRRSQAERLAINAPMQGTAADIIKIAMIEIDNWLISEKIPAKMLMQVHDELVFEAQAEQAEQICSKIKTMMEQAVELCVPILVDAGIGTSWGEAH